MGNLNDIRKGLVSALEGIPGLRATDALRSVEPPIAVVGFPTNIDYDKTFGRQADDYVIPIRVIVGLADNDAAVQLLGRFMDQADAHSIKAVLEVDRRLGGIVHDLDVTRMTGSGEVDLGEITYLVADWEVEVIG